mgnify:CR=1 FL=1
MRPRFSGAEFHDRSPFSGGTHGNSVFVGSDDIPIVPRQRHFCRKREGQQQQKHYSQSHLNSPFSRYWIIFAPIFRIIAVNSQ